MTRARFVRSPRRRVTWGFARAAARALPWIVAFAACGAKTDATLLVVDVSLKDLLPATDVDQITIDAKPATGSTAHQVYAVDATTTLPISLGLVPVGSNNQAIAITATASKAGAAVVSTTAALAFVPNKAEQIVLVLEKACALPAHAACTSGACVAGACVDPASFASQVAPYPSPLPGVDAGVPDAGHPDASTTTPDGGAKDTAPSPDTAADGGGGTKPVPGTWIAPVTMIPNTATLNAVWPLSATDAVIVGQISSQGVIYRWDGQHFNTVTVPAGTGALYGVWAAGPDDIWIVGANGTILHSAAMGFRPIASNVTVNLSSVFGFAANDVWTVGAGGTILHTVAAPTWVPVAGADAQTNLLGVAGAKANDVWVVGSGGAVMHGNAVTGFVRVMQSAGAPLFYSVWGIDTNDVWLAGEGIRAHWDGQKLTTSSLLALEAGQSIWGANGTDVWTVGRAAAGNSPIARYDGTTWTNFPAPYAGTLQSVRGVTASDVWAVGNQGTVLRFVPNK